MKCFLVITAVLHAALAGHVSVQMPYLNPAGVTYIDGSAGYAAGYAAAAPLAAPLVPASSPYTTSTYYGNGNFLGRYAHQPVLHQQVATAHAVVPTVHHVQGAVDVPVTRIQAQQGYIHKEVDVAKPAVKTSRYELRRPAIQKQFYDIEERVVVRPAGSALVELDQPHTKVHKSSVVSPLAPGHLIPAHPGVIAASPAPPALFPQPVFGISSTPGPVDQGISSDDDSVVIEARRGPQPQPQNQPQFRIQEQQPQNSQPQFRIQEQQPQNSQPQFRTQVEQQQPQFGAQIPSQFFSQIPQFRSQILSQIQPQIPQLRTQVQTQIQQQDQPENLQARSQSQSQTQAQFRSSIQPQAVVRSQSQDQSGNQQRLIELLTAREGVADVGFNAPTFRDIGDAGSVRARVLSAQVAPKDAPISGERTNTRRVVVSRPIETVEEVDVLEPITKLERLAVQHPAIFKSAHVGYERVPTSVPVYGKALAPVAPVTYAHQSPLYYH